MSGYVIADTEGSGVFDYRKPADAPGQPRMAALALILCRDDLQVEVSHSFLIRPDGWIFDNNSDAAKINGLTHERLMDEGVPAKDALRHYCDVIDARRIVAGYNVLHDLKQLRAELRHVGFPDRFMQTRYLCVMQGCRQIVDARTADGRKKAPRLEEACTFFGVDRAAPHTAFGDALDALTILQRMRDLGAMPAYTDPYDKGPKPKALRRAETRDNGWFREQGAAYEEEVMREQANFISGANEDGK